MSHYIVYHNVTSDGDQGIIVYDTNVTIPVPEDHLRENAIYAMQVAAVNVIGQGPVRETILCKGFLSFQLSWALFCTFHN